MTISAQSSREELIAEGISYRSDIYDKMRALARGDMQALAVLLLLSARTITVDVKAWPNVFLPVVDFAQRGIHGKSIVALWNLCEQRPSRCLAIMRAVQIGKLRYFDLALALAANMSADEARERIGLDPVITETVVRTQLDFFDPDRRGVEELPTFAGGVTDEELRRKMADLTGYPFGG